MAEKRSIFLTAEWRKLIMANYAVDPAILQKLVPANTKLSTYQGATYVSLVGFMFLNTRVKGIKIPFHSSFEEVNLRFYVTHQDGNEWREGVVFIKEIVPKPILALAANLLYSENYVTHPTRHHIIPSGQQLSVGYQWKSSRWNNFQVNSNDSPIEMPSGSDEEYITEKYWGYTKLNDSRTLQYEVNHPRWKMYPVGSYQLDVDFAGLYGPAFEVLSKSTPKSVLLAEGSDVIVRTGRKI